MEAESKQEAELHCSFFLLTVDNMIDRTYNKSFQQTKVSITKKVVGTKAEAFNPVAFENFGFENGQTKKNKGPLHNPSLSSFH